MTAARIARRLVRKIVKPAALWWNERALREAEDQADFYMHLRKTAVNLRNAELERAARLVGRRAEIAGW